MLTHQHVLAKSCPTCLTPEARSTSLLFHVSLGTQLAVGEWAEIAPRHGIRGPFRISAEILGMLGPGLVGLVLMLPGVGAALPYLRSRWGGEP